VNINIISIVIIYEIISQKHLVSKHTVTKNLKIQSSKNHKNYIYTDLSIVQVNVGIRLNLF